MDELLLGLDGALNMSEKMEALAKGISTNSVPMLWMSQMSTRVQEVYTLSAWFNDVSGAGGSACCLLSCSAAFSHALSSSCLPAASSKNDLHADTSARHRPLLPHRWSSATSSWLPGPRATS